MRSNTSLYGGIIKRIASKMLDIQTKIYIKIYNYLSNC